MLRLVLGYKTTRIREEDPTVIYCGHDGERAQAAVDIASGSFLSVHVAELAFTRKARVSSQAGVSTEITPNATGIDSAQGGSVPPAPEEVDDQDHDLGPSLPLGKLSK